jgi:hypothetical protein
MQSRLDELKVQVDGYQAETDTQLVDFVNTLAGEQKRKAVLEFLMMGTWLVIACAVVVQLFLRKQ